MKKGIKKTGKVIGILLLILLMIFGISLAQTIYKEKKNGTAGQDSIRVEYQGDTLPKHEIDEEAIPDSDYYATVEEAMKHADYTWREFEEYQKNIDYIIADFANDRYESILFQSFKGKKEVCLTFAKFKIKEIGGKKKYTFLSCYPCTSEEDSFYMGTALENLKSGLQLIDFEQNININPKNTRVAWGFVRKKDLEQGESIKKLRIEGQKPDEIIAYKKFGETWYFWYYEDLKSDKAGTKLNCTLGREEN